MVKSLISLLLLFNVINFSYSTKDVDVGKINKLDDALLEVKDPVTKEIVKIIIDTMKFTDLPLELGDNKEYVKKKPFVEKKIRQNLRMIGLLSAQINDNLLPFITQDFSDSKSKKENIDESHDPIKKAISNFFPEGPLWPFPLGTREPLKDKWIKWN
uniref:Uncharacterized protein n=1 Tax=Strongyloides venezuelensis TaxID=75913 RepID=A0A0K0FJF2_STRVS